MLMVDCLIGLASTQKTIVTCRQLSALKIIDFLLANSSQRNSIKHGNPGMAKHDMSEQSLHDLEKAFGSPPLNKGLNQSFRKKLQEYAKSASLTFAVKATTCSTFARENTTADGVF